MCQSARSEPFRDVADDGRRYSIVRCQDCGFVFVQNPHGETFARDQQRPPSVPERSRHRQIKRVCDRLLLRGSPAGVRRVVEVGAGWGGLAQVFARDPRYRYQGLEPSTARVEFCRANRLDVIQGFFDGPASLQGPADAIVFDNVLEHVMDPDRLFGMAAESVAPGGLIVVIVPNLRDIRRFRPAWRDRHHWQPHCHINYFSSRDLDRMFLRHQMRLRYFGVEAVGGRDDIDLLPRVLADSVGMRLFGLNGYGVKPER